MFKVDRSRLCGLPGGKTCHCGSYLMKDSCPPLDSLKAVPLFFLVNHHPPAAIPSNDGPRSLPIILLKLEHPDHLGPPPFADLACPSGPCSHQSLFYFYFSFSPSGPSISIVYSIPLP
jgi:hypothetical protein